MNFIKYQEQAWSTAVYNNKGDNPIYVAEGLGGEAGEVFELVKRMHRGQGLDFEKLKGEVGDVLWYIQGMHSEYSLPMLDCEMSAYQSACVASAKPFDIHHWSLRLSATIGRVSEWVDSVVYYGIYNFVSPVDLQHSLEACLQALTMLIHSADLQLDEVAQFNLDKLASRQERGVLRGTGSDR